MAKASNVKINLQSGTDRTVYATWTWKKENTKEYTVKWYYGTGDDVFFIGNESTVNAKNSVYTPPENAKCVKFKVKPVSKQHTVNKKNVNYWTAEWSTSSVYFFSKQQPVTPDVPTVNIKNTTMTIELDDSDHKENKNILFDIFMDESRWSSLEVKKQQGYARIQCDIEAGHRYKVRAYGLSGSRSTNKINMSEPSKFSESVNTIPATSLFIKSLMATSHTSVYLSWESMNGHDDLINVESFNVEYTSDKDWFDSSDQTQTINVTARHAEIVGLESGKAWFFRVQSVNEVGESGWSTVEYIRLGKKPSAPTTWSSTNTGIIGEDINLYWMHNSEDNSSQTKAQLKLTVNGEEQTIVVENSSDEDEKDKTSVYKLDTSSYKNSVKILWQVRTKGVTDEYSDWSIEREIKLCEKPAFKLSIIDSTGSISNELHSFPILLRGEALSGIYQEVIGCVFTITANESYMVYENDIDYKFVNVNEQIFSKYQSEKSSYNTVTLLLRPGDVLLKNNISYTITGVVTLDSGLTAEDSITVFASWDDDIYEPDAEIGIDTDNLIAYIRPYCVDENDALTSDVLLSVYRMNSDGSFTEIMSDIENNQTYIIDPHPTLNHVRYRIVATSKTSGLTNYYDTPAYPVEEPSIVIQWNEHWEGFSGTSEDELENQPWNGYMLKLLYNIDTSENNDIDVSLVKYIGRSNPVSYYGTQLGYTAKWNAEIVSTDTETIDLLRRLTRWTGDVYVREPSGTGYWANITVSFNKKHTELTIPVSINVTRVEGGV